MMGTRPGSAAATKLLGKLSGPARLAARLLVVAPLLAGCGHLGETSWGSPWPDSWNDADAGTFFGVVSGGLIGAQFGHGGGKVAGAVVGAAAGGLVGNSIGRDLDARAGEKASAAEAAALENSADGVPVRWAAEEQGISGSVVLGAKFESGHGVCRDYAHTLYRNGLSKTARGIACRKEDGTWAIMH